MCCKTACLLNVLNLRNYKTQGNTAKIASIKQIGSGIEIWASMRLCVCLSMSEAGHRAIKGKEGWVLSVFHVKLLWPSLQIMTRISRQLYITQRWSSLLECDSWVSHSCPSWFSHSNRVESFRKGYLGIQSTFLARLLLLEAVFSLLNFKVVFSSIKMSEMITHIKSWYAPFRCSCALHLQLLFTWTEMFLICTEYVHLHMCLYKPIISPHLQLQFSYRSHLMT